MIEQIRTACLQGSGVSVRWYLSVNVVVVASVTAAVFSVFNVLLTARLSQRGQLDQWRRDTERPIVARILMQSRETLEQLRQVADLREEWIPSIGGVRSNEEAATRDAAARTWELSRASFDSLRFEIAQLDLIAGHPPRDLTRKLMSAHESLRHWLRPASGASDSPMQLWSSQSGEVASIEKELIAAVRTDLGVDRGRRHLN